MIDPELQAHLDAYRAAVLAKDAAAFVALYAADVRVFDMWGSWSFEGRDAWQTNVAGWFGSLGDERVEVAFDGIRATVVEPAAAVHACVEYRAVAQDGASAGRAMRNRITWLLERRDGAWRIVHEHTSAPLDPATSKAMFA